MRNSGFCETVFHLENILQVYKKSTASPKPRYREEIKLLLYDKKTTSYPSADGWINTMLDKDADYSIIKCVKDKNVMGNRVILSSDELTDKYNKKLNDGR